MTHGTGERKRWLALIMFCLGVLMVVLDTTIVNVALPSIQVGLGFTKTSLVWVVNVYMLTLGGCSPLGGRLGDLFGHQRLFLLGLALFTLTSVVCGLVSSRGPLIVARAVQGLGGTVVSAVLLSLIMNLLTSPADHTKATGIYDFVCADGGSIGALLGDLLTNTLSWHWIFLASLPIGMVVYTACVVLLPVGRPLVGRTKLNMTGVIVATASLMLAVYAIVHGNKAGWTPTQALTQLGIAIMLMIAFLVIESYMPHPLMPLYVFMLRNVTTANVVGMPWAVTMSVWFFISALYMQRVLDYSAMQARLAFLPVNIIMAVFLLGSPTKLVIRFGIRAPLPTGLLAAGIGLVLLARAPAGGDSVLNILLGMLLLGLGAGVVLNPVLLTAMSNAALDESGLTSGVVNTSFAMGDVLGLAILASPVAARTEGPTATGADAATTPNGGYHLAFLLGAVAALLGSVLADMFVCTHVHGPVQAEASSAAPV